MATNAKVESKAKKDITDGYRPLAKNQKLGIRFRPTRAAEIAVALLNKEGVKASLEVGKDRKGHPDPRIICDDMPRAVWTHVTAEAVRLYDAERAGGAS